MSLENSTDRPECPMETHVEKQGEHLNANSNTCNDSTIHLYNCFKILKRYILLSKERHESKVACSQAVSQQQKNNMEEQQRTGETAELAQHRCFSVPSMAGESCCRNLSRQRINQCQCQKNRTKTINFLIQF